MERPMEYLPRVPAPQPFADYNMLYHPQPGFQPIQQPAYSYSPQQAQALQSAGAPVVVMVMPSQLTDVPGQMRCPYCQNVVVTQVRYRNGCYTWMVSGQLAAFMCCFCYRIPFCVDSCKDVEHICPHCQNVLHIHKRMTSQRRVDRL